MIVKSGCLERQSIRMTRLRDSVHCFQVGGVGSKAEVLAVSMQKESGRLNSYWWRYGQLLLWDWWLNFTEVFLKIWVKTVIGIEEEKLNGNKDLYSTIMWGL